MNRPASTPIRPRTPKRALHLAVEAVIGGRDRKGGDRVLDIAPAIFDERADDDPAHVEIIAGVNAPIQTVVVLVAAIGAERGFGAPAAETGRERIGAAGLSKRLSPEILRRDWCRTGYLLVIVVDAPGGSRSARRHHHRTNCRPGQRLVSRR